MENVLLRLENISVRLGGSEILKSIDLYIKDKEFVTLLGPSGCGKTTTLRIIAGFLNPDSGNVYFNGAKPCDIEEDFTVDTEHEVALKLVEKDGKYTVESDLFKYLPKGKMICSDTLGMAFEPEERFEQPDGSDIVFDTDIYGNKRPTEPVAGPFA